MQGMRRRLCAALVATGCALGVVACGGRRRRRAGRERRARRRAADLQPIKDYLLEHTAPLNEDAGRAARGRRGVLRPGRGRRLRLRASCSRTSATRSQALVKELAGATSPAPTRPTRRWRASSPACPSLADYDVIIDAGADGSDPENAVPFSLKTPAGKTFKQPGQLHLPDRDVASSAPSRSSRPRASSPTSTATARSSSARRCPTPTSYVAAATRLRARRRRSSTRPRKRVDSRRRRTRSPRSS